LKGFKLEVLRTEGRTPLIFIEIDGTNENAPTTLLYGHMDKQPPFEGWSEGLGPYTPVIKDGRLYGRGGADDGYSIFSALGSIGALQNIGLPHPRCVVVIEASEESGSPDLPYYVEKLKDRIGQLSLIVCLDSGAGDYEHFWMTTSLRGLIAGNLNVRILREGVHSGHASGIVPSTFRILRLILDRIEDPKTGKVLPPAFDNGIPEQIVEQSYKTAEVLGRSLVEEMPWISPEAEPVGGKDNDLAELLLNRTWRATVSITGADGLPPLSNAGNVLRPYTGVKISARLPPNVNSHDAQEGLKQALEAKPVPYNAHVEFVTEKCADGWSAPPLVPWLEEAVQAAAQTYFNKPSLSLGEGGSIPFMGMLGKLFPQAQFVVTGVLGPQSNAHGPNEFLDIKFSKKITCCVAHILHQQALRPSS